MKPYTEEKHSSYIIREFSQDTPSFEFVWHRDKKDRVVETINNTDWLFQLDNELPQRFPKDKLFIPRETYHRVIKGTGNLVVKIWENY